MALEKRNRTANGLLWAGLAMIGTALVLTLVGSFYAGRAGGYSGPGGMMGPGSMMSPGGMMGQGYGASGWGPQGDVGSLPEARDAFERAVQSYDNPDLEVAEVMEFANNYYAEVREKDTGTGAMELLIDKPSGQVFPEPGPNMMWNAKYGMMSGVGGYRGMGGMMGPNGPGQARAGALAGEMTVSPEQAREIADAYVGRVSPGTQAGEAEEFYGYYTLHTKRDGETTGMLSVNCYSGEVWYHSWHGPFVAMEEE
jgi:hypothetical protein